MEETNESVYINDIQIDGDGTLPDIFCPVCGKSAVKAKEKCAHVLFQCTESEWHGITFRYVHPKLKATISALKDKYPDQVMESEADYISPRGLAQGSTECLVACHLASELGLDEGSTLVLEVRNLIVDSARADMVWEVVAIEFPPLSYELKMYKRAEAGNLSADTYKQWILDELERHRKANRTTIALEALHTFIGMVLEAIPDSAEIDHHLFFSALLSLRQEERIRVLKLRGEEWRILTEDLDETDFRISMARYNLNRYAVELMPR